MTAPVPPSPTAHLSGERVVDIAGDLLGVDSQNPPGDTRELAALVESFLDDLGLATERVAVDPAKPNLLATIPGERDRTLLFNGHLDTVPFDVDEWTHDPLGERDGDRLYGRGATDMKGPFAAMLHAAEAFVETDTTPPVDLAFAFVSDEETGGGAGVGALLERGAVDADACVIGETTCAGGNHSVTVADRGSIWLTLRASGEAAHGSRPMLGANAIDRLWAAITAIRSRLPARALDLPAAMDAIVEESVAYYEPTMGAETARTLFEHPTVNLGTIAGGESINTVPGSATAELDIRLAAGVETPAVLADIRDCLDDYPHVAVADASWSVGTYEPPDSPLVEAVASLAADVTDERVYRRSATGGGDAKKFRNAGIPTVEFALGTDTVHAVDEYTTVDALAGTAEVYTRLPAAYAEAVD